MLVLITAAALLLGYGFNLLRLCVLVVYYRIGVALPSIQKHGAARNVPSMEWFLQCHCSQAMPVQFVTSFYDDGNGRQYDAESTCSLGGCSANTGAFRRSGFYFTAPGLFRLTTALSGKFSLFTSGHSLPIVLRREWTETEQASPYDLRAQFEADARLFMAQLDMKPLLLQDGSHLEVETSSELLRSPLAASTK